MIYFSNNLKFLREKANKTLNEMAFELGFSTPSRFNNYENGTSKPDFDTLLAISKHFKYTIDDLLYKDLSNPNYMETSIKTSTVSDSEVIYNTKKQLPLIPFSAMAGFANGINDPILAEDCEYYSVPEFNKKADYLIRINGSSMYPKYNSGDIIACKKLPLGTFFQWNKTYVLDTIQGALVKRVNQGSSSENIKLVSDNPSYPEFELPITEIHALALVVGVIRFE
jgi:phage repressor protein C with HTH and peptisase S24 domain